MIDSQFQSMTFNWLYSEAVRREECPSAKSVLDASLAIPLSEVMRSSLFGHPDVSTQTVQSFARRLNSVLPSDERYKDTLTPLLELMGIPPKRIALESLPPHGVIGPSLLFLLSRAEVVFDRINPGGDGITASHFIIALYCHPEFFDPRIRARSAPSLLPSIRAAIPKLFKSDAAIVLTAIDDEAASSTRWTKAPGTGPLTTQLATRATDRPLPPKGQDALGLDRDAKALAELICLKDPGPPLAIGVFGDWGAGKSTFMAMIENRVAQTASDADQVFKNNPSGPAPIFVQNVVQITFNAWHYTEADLWSSLAAHIFRSLFEQAHLPTDPKEPKRPDWLTPERFKTLLHDLTEARMVDTHTEQARKDAQEALSKAQFDVAAARQKRDQLAAAAAGDLNAIFGMIEKPDAQTIQALDKALVAIGGQPVFGDTASLGRIVQERRRAAGRLSAWINTTLSSTSIMIGAIAATIAGSAWVGFAPSLTEAFDQLSAMIGVICGSGFVGSAISGLAKALTALEKITQEGDRIIAQAHEVEAEAKDELTKAEIRLDRAEVAYQQARRRREGLEALTDADNPEAALNAFLDARLSDGRYRDQLGIVSKLHDDFSALSSLIEASESRWRKHRLTQLRTGKGVDPPNTLQRIVLYIDDLDRCPDEIVVKVLEAVHLLLALPLFAVVVGVDGRWLEGALARQYKHQLGQEGSAKPSDYLEKIFQLPYWLPQLDNGATDDGSLAKLIGQMAPEVRNAERLVTSLKKAGMTGGDDNAVMWDASDDEAQDTDTIRPVAGAFGALEVERIQILHAILQTETNKKRFTTRLRLFLKAGAFETQEDKQMGAFILALEIGQEVPVVKGVKALISFARRRYPKHWPERVMPLFEAALANKPAHPITSQAISALYSDLSKADPDFYASLNRRRTALNALLPAVQVFDALNAHCLANGLNPSAQPRTSVLEDIENRASAYLDRTFKWDRDPPLTEKEAKAAERQQVTLSEEELLIMRSFGTLIRRSPRGLKRYINSFRFLKASGAFANAREVRVGLFLLALEVGLPSKTHAAFRAVLDFALTAIPEDGIASVTGAIEQATTSQIDPDLARDEVVKFHASLREIYGVSEDDESTPINFLADIEPAMNALRALGKLDPDKPANAPILTGLSRKGLEESKAEWERVMLELIDQCKRADFARLTFRRPY